MFGVNVSQPWIQSPKRAVEFVGDDFFDGKLSFGVSGLVPSEQCSKHLLVDDYMGLCYPIYKGFLQNPVEDSPKNRPGFETGILNTAHLC